MASRALPPGVNRVTHQTISQPTASPKAGGAKATGVAAALIATPADSFASLFSAPDVLRVIETAVPEHSSQEPRKQVLTVLGDRERLASVAALLASTQKALEKYLLSGAWASDWLGGHVETAKGSVPVEMALLADSIDSPALGKDLKKRLEGGLEAWLDKGLVAKAKALGKARADAVTEATPLKYGAPLGKHSASEVISLYAKGARVPYAEAITQLSMNAAQPDIVEAIAATWRLDHEKVSAYFDHGAWGRLDYNPGESLTSKGLTLSPLEVADAFIERVGLESFHLETTEPADIGTVAKKLKVHPTDLQKYVSSWRFEAELQGPLAPVDLFWENRSHGDEFQWDPPVDIESGGLFLHPGTGDTPTALLAALKEDPLGLRASQIALLKKNMTRPRLVEGPPPNTTDVTLSAQAFASRDLDGLERLIVQNAEASAIAASLNKDAEVADAPFFRALWSVHRRLEAGSGDFDLPENQLPAEMTVAEQQALKAAAARPSRAAAGVAAASHLADAPKPTELVTRLLAPGSVADERDVAVAEQLLGAIAPAFLRSVEENGFRFSVSREAARLQDPMVIELHTEFRDGLVVIDPGAVLHRLGQLLDTELHHERLSETESIVSAYATERSALPPAFADQADFTAEAIARLALDPDRMNAEMPLTTSALRRQLGERGLVVDAQRMAHLQQSMRAELPVSTSASVADFMRACEQANEQRARGARSRQPYVIELDGEPAAATAVVRSLGDALWARRSPKSPPYRVDDPVTRVTSAEFNDSVRFEEMLSRIAKSPGSLLHIDEPEGIDANSDGFKVLNAFVKANGDRAPLVVSGDKAARAAFRAALEKRSAVAFVSRPSVKGDPAIGIAALTPEQTVELVRRLATNEGYVVSNEALERLGEVAQGGGFSQAHALWRGIKTAENERVAASADSSQVGVIAATDVTASSSALVKGSALDAVNSMVELTEAKEMVRSIIAAAKIQALKLSEGMPVKSATNLNIVFAGNPGTGKTEMAKNVARALFEARVTTDPEPLFLKAAQFKGPDGAKLLADTIIKNKGRAIFMDEAHQLPKDVLEALIPFMADKDYLDTPIIMAGYLKEMAAMLQADLGGQSRVETVIFKDYSREGLGRILDQKIDADQLKVSPAVREAILDAVERRQNAMLHPDNGRSVEKVLAATIRNQGRRLGELARVTKAQLSELKLGDVPKGPSVTPAEVLAKMQKAGLDDLASMLWGFDGVIADNRSKGQPPLEGISTNFIVSADHAGRREEVLGLISEFFYAHGLLAEAAFERHGGIEFQGGFVGNSTSLQVESLYSGLGGKMMVIDDPTGMLGVGAFEKAATSTLQDLLGSDRQFTTFFGTQEQLGTYFGRFPGLLEHTNAPVHIEAASKAGASNSVEEAIGGLKLTLSKAGSTALRDALGTLEGPVDARVVATQIRMAHLRAGSKDITAESVNQGLAAYAKQRDAFAALLGSAKRQPNDDEEAPPLAFQHATAKRSNVAPPKGDRPTLDSAAAAVHQAYLDVSQAFAALANRDPKAFIKQQSDPNSDFNKALGKKLGVSGAKAMAQAQSVLVRVRKLVEVFEKTKRLQFEYVCPYCRGTNSSACHYFTNSPGTYDRAWLIANSLKKPYEVEATTSRMVEKVVEEQRPTGKR